MKLLNHNYIFFCVAHLQGKFCGEYSTVIEELFAHNIVLPDNVQIVTATNQEDMLLHLQLKKNNIACINEAQFGGRWLNTMKIGYIIKGLQKVTSDYALILDSSDVLLTEDVKNISEKFETFDKEIIFGATKYNYPDLIIDYVLDREQRGEFKYLNAGTAFGRKTDLLGFYRQCEEEVQKRFVGNYEHSEQRIIRQVFDRNKNTVDFDSQSLLFQTFGGVTMQVIDVETFLIT